MIYLSFIMPFGIRTYSKHPSYRGDVQKYSVGNPRKLSSITTESDFIMLLDMSWIRLFEWLPLSRTEEFIHTKKILRIRTQCPIYMSLLKVNETENM
ncbi:unnamed protein product [Schistosoma curassoni]|uniref:Uncharacterized protein n=1 Tax=Schistosoma curassoni TaxID=6186 RepID=A0A183JZR5_9TREM|nr:unnamed protein product [Schistosoma curassoni]